MPLIPGLTYWNSYKVVAWRYAAGCSGYVNYYGWFAIAYFGGGGGWKRKTLEILLLVL